MHGNPFRYCDVKGCGWQETPTPSEAAITHILSANVPVTDHLAVRLRTVIQQIEFVLDRPDEDARAWLSQLWASANGGCRRSSECDGGPCDGCTPTGGTPNGGVPCAYHLDDCACRRTVAKPDFPTSTTR